MSYIQVYPCEIIHLRGKKKTIYKQHEKACVGARNHKQSTGLVSLRRLFHNLHAINQFLCTILLTNTPTSSFSIEKVSKITSPVLIIHGTEDEVIDFSHGLALFERCPKAVEPLWVEGAGHNDIELYSQYLERLRRFIGQELAAQHI